MSKLSDISINKSKIISALCEMTPKEVATIMRNSAHIAKKNASKDYSIAYRKLDSMEDGEKRDNYEEEIDQTIGNLMYQWDEIFNTANYLITDIL